MQDAPQPSVTSTFRTKHETEEQSLSALHELGLLGVGVAAATAFRVIVRVSRTYNRALCRGLGLALGLERVAGRLFRVASRIDSDLDAVSATAARRVH